MPPYKTQRATDMSQLRRGLKGSIAKRVLISELEAADANPGAGADARPPKPGSMGSTSRGNHKHHD